MAAARLAPGAFASGSSLGVSLAPRAGPAAPRSPARGGPRRRHHLRRRGADDDSRGAASPPGVVVARAAASSSSPAPVKTSADVVIVGGGLAGLCCARRLAASGVDFVLLESSDGVGGRLRTDVVDGFLLDRGFAIFLTGYPEAKATLDYDALDLRPFYAGADVRFEGAFHRVADPLRHPLDAIASLDPSHPIGSVFDKILVGLVRLNALLGDVYDSLTAPETTIAGRLNERGFSPEMQHRFFRPFMSGIFFDPKLGTSSRLFEFVMRMLAVGQNCLPARGIGDVAEQLLGTLPSDAVRLNAEAVEVRPKTAADGDPGGSSSSKIVTLRDGASVESRSGVVIVATSGPDAERLAGVDEKLRLKPSASGDAVGTTCLYFAIDGPAPRQNCPILYLNGDGPGLVNNCCFPSAVADTYAPAGTALASVSLVGVPASPTGDALVETVRGELRAWFGAEVDGWRHLRTYEIPFAQPNQQVPTDLERDVRLGDGVYACGDHRSPATFDGAMRSGRMAAEAAIEDMGW